LDVSGISRAGHRQLVRSAVVSCHVNSTALSIASQLINVEVSATMKMLAVASVLFAITTYVMPQGMTDVVVVDGADRIQMKYSLADNQISSNVFGSKAHSTLNGKRADLRIKNASPQFMLYSDPAVNLSNAAVLVRLDVKTDHREIRTMKVNMGSLSSSLPKDHVIDMNIEQVRTEPGNRRMNLYKMTPTSPLKPGEYCLIRNRTYFFDFGVDAN